jgi:hypothetical protein
LMMRKAFFVIAQGDKILGQFSAFYLFFIFVYNTTESFWIVQNSIFWMTFVCVASYLGRPSSMRNPVQASVN